MNRLLEQVMQWIAGTFGFWVVAVAVRPFGSDGALGTIGGVYGSQVFAILGLALDFASLWATLATACLIMWPLLLEKRRTLAITANIVILLCMIGLNVVDVEFSLLQRQTFNIFYLPALVPLAFGIAVMLVMERRHLLREVGIGKALAVGASTAVAIFLPAGAVILVALLAHS